MSGADVRRALAAACLAAAAGCAPGSGTGDALPRWSFDAAMVFPADRSLAGPEDGVALPDGRLIVTDQVHGLRLVDVTGNSAPFGDLAGAGYVHAPPDRNGGAAGVSLEPDGRHLLLADFHGGAIFRVHMASGAAERVYQHRYGVNAAVRDSLGSIWFTQSTANVPEAAEEQGWTAADVPTPDGALLRLPAANGRLATTAEVVVDGLLYANGLAIDERTGHLYVAETTGGRVLRYRMDLASGRVSDRAVFADIAGDNLELDAAGRLWVASPLTNGVVVVDTATGRRHTVFQRLSPAQAARYAEFNRRGATGTSRLELLTPDLWMPLPGLLTGVILSGDGDPVYITGLGDALIRLAR